MNWKKLLPIAEWLPKYKREYLWKDLISGISVAVLLVPQGMAYALLAGLPPVYGLYASLIPPLIYMLFGSSPYLSLGPVALISILLLSGLSEFAVAGSTEFIALAITTSLMAGVLQLSFGLLRMGFLVNFLSHPVIAGFTSAAAVLIGFSQLKHILGISMERSNALHEALLQLLEQISTFHVLTAIIGVLSIGLIIGLKRINKGIPTALIAVTIGTFIVWFFQWNESGVSVVGAVPEGLTKFKVPRFDWETLQLLFPLSLTIAVISFIESLAIAKILEAKHKTHKISANQELIALGLSKIGGSFFQSFPATASFSRSALSSESNGQTNLSFLFTTALVALTALFLTPLFFYLPKAVLAAIIIASVFKFIAFSEAKSLWKLDRRDFLNMFATFIITLTVGIQQGVIAGILLSIFLIVYRNARPHVAVLGQLPETNKYRNINRFENLKQWESLLIFRFDAQLYFANIEHFKKTIDELVNQHSKSLKAIILDASSIHDIDSSGIHTLEEVVQELQQRDIQFVVAEAIGPFRDSLHQNGLIQKIGRINHFMYVHDAVQYFVGDDNERSEESIKNAVQTDFKRL